MSEQDPRNTQELGQQFHHVSDMTSKDLLSATSTAKVLQHSHLSLPEVEHIMDLVAHLIPAGNVSSMILNGLASGLPEDYLDAYANGLNSYVGQLIKITDGCQPPTTKRLKER